MRTRDMGSAGRVLLAAACLMVVVAGLKAAQALLVPLVFSAFLAIISAPLVSWLRRRRIPDVLAVVLVVAVVLVALVALAGVVGGSVNTFVSAAPAYQERLAALVSGTLIRLKAYGVEAKLDDIGSMVNPSAAISLLGGTVTQVAAMLSDTFLVILTLVFLLFESTVLPAKIRAALGDPKADLERFSVIMIEVNHYVVIKTYLSLATGAVVWLMLWILGVDFSLLWALLAFLLNYVPNVGALIAGVPPAVLALLQFGPGRAAIAIVGFVAVHLVIGNMIEPRVMGRRLGLSTLVVFLSLIFWGWLWGPMGMLLSVPLTMILKILLENSEDLRWLALLMDGEVSPPPPASMRPPAAPSAAALGLISTPAPGPVAGAGGALSTPAPGPAAGAGGLMVTPAPGAVAGAGGALSTPAPGAVAGATPGSVPPPASAPVPVAKPK